MKHHEFDQLQNLARIYQVWLSTKGIDPAEIRDNDLEILQKQKNSGVGADRGLYSAANFV